VAALHLGANGLGFKCFHAAKLAKSN